MTLFNCSLRQAAAMLATLIGMVVISLPQLQAQAVDWRAEANSIRHTIEAAEEASISLTASIHDWKMQRESGEREFLTGAEQTQWSLRMASLNRNYQAMLAFSDQYEAARKLLPRQFLERYGNGKESHDLAWARAQHLRLLILLLETDRATYGIADSLRLAAGLSPAIRNRLNEGNRSFGIQYGIFEEMTATFFDPGRRRRTRSRYKQLHRQRDYLATVIAEADPKLYQRAESLLEDPALRKIASQAEVSVVFANSMAALGSVVDPSVDLAARTFHNLSQFFGNFVGTNLFRVFDFLGIGESRGHGLPAFYKYYPHPDGSARGVHPEKVGELENRLVAGDVIFDKTRFAITDKLIPGYFGHIAIYLQSYETLQAAGVFATDVMKEASQGMSAAEIDRQVDAYAAEIEGIQGEEWIRMGIMRRRMYAKTFHGEPLNPLLFEALYRLKYRKQNVLEGLRDGQTIAAHEGGVTLHRFEDFLYIDDFGAMRLRRREQREDEYRQMMARFLALALLQYGKPYDFRFDVNTVDAIVCSELIYLSFVGVEFTTTKSLGSFTISPDQVAQEAGIKTVLDTLEVDPPFELVQWFADAMPLYPQPVLDETAATSTRSTTLDATDSLVIRAFMATVREEWGGLKLLSANERQRFESYKTRARLARERESDRLKKLPAQAASPPVVTVNRSQERRLQNFYIELQRRLAAARETGKSESEIKAIEQELVRRFVEAQAPHDTLATEERSQVWSQDFNAWQRGPAYRPSYVDLYSGKERFFLSVFRSAGFGDDDAFGRGVSLQFAGNNESPRRSLIYTQYYSFLPFYVELFDNSGRVRKNLQGGAMLAHISRRYHQGDFVEMNALSWRNSAYATTFLPFAIQAGGDKGPVDALLELSRLGNGHYQSGPYFGEFGRLEFLPFERRMGRHTFTVAKLIYGARAQITFGKFRVFARGAVGMRLGKFGERRKNNPATDFPPIRSWAFGVELTGSTLYRPTRHRVELEIIEDDARFIAGRLQKDRQARISYRWSMND